VFDMDDTLYPYRRFVLSGFAAAARHLARTCAVDRVQIFRALTRASRGADRGRELQSCLAAFDLPPGLLPELVAIVRSHPPAIRLTRGATRTLRVLRAAGWRLGVLTNGPAEIQSRKVAALGIAAHVDRVVYATQHGSGAGKPEAAPFAEIARQLDVPAAHTVFVGDDETCDIEGATGAGMHPVRCAIWIRSAAATADRPVIDRFSYVPHVARALLEEASSRHAA
jgi:HAD superfamily hydrolase (TIGR01509 family)